MHDKNKSFSKPVKLGSDERWYDINFASLGEHERTTKLKQNQMEYNNLNMIISCHSPSYPKGTLVFSNFKVIIGHTPDQHEKKQINIMPQKIVV